MQLHIYLTLTCNTETDPPLLSDVRRPTPRYEVGSGRMLFSTRILDNRNFRNFASGMSLFFFALLVLVLSIGNVMCKDLYDIRDRSKGNCDFSFNSDLSKNGTFASPGYPTPYPARTTCRYDFTGRGRERIQITFQDFNLYHPKEETKDCDSQDSLIAFVHSEGRDEIIGSFCGSGLPKPVMSNGPKLKLELLGLQGSRYSRGFKATYSFTENYGIKTGEKVEEDLCGFSFSSNKSRTGFFHSPNYPGFYPMNTECHYYFYGNSNEKVSLHFNYFDVEGVLPCEAISASDYVEFSNFMARDRKYQRHCGQLKEFDIESDRKFFRVTFRSNDRLDGTGFNASYQFLKKVEGRMSMPGFISVGCNIGVSTCLIFVSGVLQHLII